jgi:hypothetical protein
VTALLNRQELFDRLSQNVVDLYFEKADGTKRRMRATLMESETGDEPTPPGPNTKNDFTGLMAVYDMDLKDWRSFRIERVSTVLTPSLGELKTDGTDNL